MSATPSRPSVAWPTARMMWNDFAVAMRWGAAVVTLMAATALAGSLAPYERVVASGHPWWPATTCSGCVLCGMTRGFCAMSSGRWADAAAWNGAAPWVYAAAWAWVAAALWLALRFMRCWRASARRRRSAEVGGER